MTAASQPALGTLPDGRQVLPVEKLTDLVRRPQIHIGVITVPEDAAQAVADAMVAGGIQVILNVPLKDG